MSICDLPVHLGVRNTLCPVRTLRWKLYGSGTITVHVSMTTGKIGMSLEIPSSLLVEVLAGREQLLQGKSGMDPMLENFSVRRLSRRNLKTGERAMR